MKATLPCHKPHQLSLFSSEVPPPGHHIWKNGVCVDCGMHKNRSIVTVCDCGCRTPINSDTVTTCYGKLTFVFGHETLSLFGDSRVVKSTKKVPVRKMAKVEIRKKTKKKSRKSRKKKP